MREHPRTIAGKEKTTAISTRRRKFGKVLRGIDKAQKTKYKIAFLITP